MASDNRPKKSWRDIDKARDGSRGSRQGSEPRRDPQADREQKQYRAALEALFEKGGIGKLADKLSATGARGPLSAEDLRNLPKESDESGAAEALAREAEAADAPSGTPAPVAAAASTPAAAEGRVGAAAGKKKGAEDRVGLRRKLLEAAGRQEISRAAEKYLERFPLPDDHEVLEQLLEHEKEPRVLQAMERIGHLLDLRQTPKRSRALCGKLRYLADTASSDEVRRKAQELLRRLS